MLKANKRNDNNPRLLRLKFLKIELPYKH